MGDEYVEEEKKSFALIYIIVAVFYAVMITVYGVVVHKYKVDDDALNIPPSEKDCPGGSNPNYHVTVAINAVKTLLSMATGYPLNNADANIAVDQF